MNEKTDSELIRECHSALCGVPGSKGLIKRVDDLEWSAKSVNKKLLLASGMAVGVISCWEVIRFLSEHVDKITVIK